MRAILTASLMLTIFGAASFSTSANAGESPVKELRDTENLPTWTAKKDPLVSCVEPHCVHEPNGQVNAPASSQVDRNAQGSAK